MSHSALNKNTTKRGRVTSLAEGIQIEESSVTLQICIAINNEEGTLKVSALRLTLTQGLLLIPGYHLYTDLQPQNLERKFRLGNLSPIGSIN